jgi:YtxH-like protein
MRIPEAIMKSFRKRKASMKSFLTGLALGFGAAVLFAPSSGEQTRRSFKRKVEHSRDRVSGKISEIRKKIGGSDASQANSVAVHVLNTIDRHQLLDLYAMNPPLADRIIAGRPYDRIEQVVELGLVPTTAVERFTQDLRAKSGKRRA